MSKKKKSAPARSTLPVPALVGIASGIAVIVALLWIVGVFGSGKTSTASAASPSAPASLAPGASAPAAPGQPFAGTFHPSQGHTHLDPSEPDDFIYNSNPPTSGPHREIFSDKFVSPTPLPNYEQVHLLEHGNVLLQYNCTCPDVAAALAAIAYEYDSKLIAPNELQPTPEEVQAGEEAGKAVLVAPYPHMGARIALTAWTRLATLDTVDKPKIESFIGLYLANEANAGQ